MCNTNTVISGNTQPEVYANSRFRRQSQLSTTPLREGTVVDTVDVTAEGTAVDTVSTTAEGTAVDTVVLIDYV